MWVSVVNYVVFRTDRYWYYRLLASIPHARPIRFGSSSVAFTKNCTVGCNVNNRFDSPHPQGQLARPAPELATESENAFDREREANTSEC
jgi:hypothetical protein